MVKVMEAPRSVGQPTMRCRRGEPSAAPVPPVGVIPSWAQLPAVRRRRLVAVLGELVLRKRAGKEDGDEGT